MRTRIATVLERGVLVLLAIRPSLDLFTKKEIQLGTLALNPAGILGLVMIALGGAWLVTLSKEEKASLLSQPLAWVLALWMILLLPWAIFYFGKASAGLEGIREWLRLLALLPIVLVGIHLSVKGRYRTVIHYILLSAVVPLLLGLYQLQFHEGLMVRGVHRITGTFVHPNPYSFFLVLLIGVTFWMWRTHSPQNRWALLLILEVVLLIGTYSFTGAAMLAVFIAVWILRMNSYIRLAALVSLLLFVLLFILTPNGRERIREVSQIDRLDEIERTGKETSSFTWRLLNWRFLYRTWKEQPWLGYGLGSSTRVNPNFNKYEGRGHYPHNDYIRFLVETGLFGFVLYLILLIGVGYVLWHAHRQDTVPEAQSLAWFAFCIYCSWMVGSINDNLSIATGYQYALWAFFASAGIWQRLEPNTPIHEKAS